MKRIFSFIIAGCLASLLLVSCKDPEVKLHALVGTPLEDGFVFHVRESEDSALICANSELLFDYNTGAATVRFEIGTYIWNKIGRDSMSRYDTIFNPSDTTQIDEIDTTYFRSYIGAISTDGRINTNLILNRPLPNKPEDIKGDISESAARHCKNFYSREKIYALFTHIPKSEYDSDTIGKINQGKWFLPSMQELQYLYDARNKLNENDPVVFRPLQDICFWSSNEWYDVIKDDETPREDIPVNRVSPNAFYKCLTDNGIESYVSKASSSHRVSIRPVRWVAIPTP